MPLYLISKDGNMYVCKAISIIMGVVRRTVFENAEVEETYLSSTFVLGRKKDSHP